MAAAVKAVVLVEAKAVDLVEAKVLDLAAAKPVEVIVSTAIKKDEFLDWLVDRVDFARKVDEVAAKLAGLAPLSMRNMKRAIEQFAQAEPDIPRIRDGIRECQTSEDLREGLVALREKRPPAFKGR